MRPYQSLLVKIQKGRRAVVAAGLQPKRQTLDFRHWTKALLSFQERLGEVSFKKQTLDFGHQPKEKTLKIAKLKLKK